MIGRTATWRGSLGLVAAVAFAVASACRPALVVEAGRAPGGAAQVVSRNVEASDYVGSARCAPCHAELVQGFGASPMHRMTRDVEGAVVRAPFAGEGLSLGDDHATLETRDGGRFVRVDSGGHASLYRVTRIIGGRHREDFVGVLVPSYAASVDAAGKGDELVLPVSYLIDKKRLRYKGYSVMVPERSHLVAGPVWNRTCPFCHNTVPLLSTLLGTLAGPHAPRYQGEVVDRLLPDDRVFRYDVTDPPALASAVAREEARLGVPSGSGALHDELRAAISATASRFTGAKLLEVGIGCEACHGGAREHVANPSVHPSLLPRAPYLAVRVGGKAPTSASVEDHACARCHQVLFSRYPWTWEGGRRNAMPGGSHISSGEARDLLLGGCQGALKCTACHDPHAADETAHLASLATPAGNGVCTSCHAALVAPDALRKHAHHDPSGAGGSCVACHMAKKNISLDARLSRYHRIGSPTDAARVLGDRPLECALCHEGKTVGALASAMEAWWGKSYEKDVLRRLYGSLEENPLRATLARGKPHEKAVALYALGTARARDGALFLPELANEYPVVREYAADALHSVYGVACDLDVAADRATLTTSIARCAAEVGSVGPPAPTTPGGRDETPVDD